MTSAMEEARKMADTVLENLMHYRRGCTYEREDKAALAKAFLAAIELGERRERSAREFRLASGQLCPHGSTGPCSVCGDAG